MLNLPTIQDADDFRTALSGICGCVSIACWVIVFTPQLYENWRRKSSEGLSLAFVVIWLAGDFFNVIGALLQKVLPTMIILAVYYTVADLILYGQCLVYGRRNAASGEQEPLLEPTSNSNSNWVDEPKASEWRKNVLIVSGVVLAGIIGYLLSDKTSGNQDGPQPINFWGQVWGWVCAVLYLASRLPQIKLNYDRKSTDGIAFLFFTFAALGNMTYVASILLADASKHALLINASWLAGAIGTLFLDGIIFVQFYTYNV